MKIPQFSSIVFQLILMLLLAFKSGALAASLFTGAEMTSAIWQEVDLVYMQKFIGYTHQTTQLPKACELLRSVVVCQAQMQLLRPAEVIKRWQQQQRQQGYVLFSLPEMGIDHIHTHIIAVKPSSFNPKQLSLTHSPARPVIGIFIKHTTQVNQYTFRDEVTGRLSKMNATPNHPFYVTQLHRYKAVDDLSLADHLINVSGHSTALVCPPGKFRHCGCPYHVGQITPVYNLEVFQQHRYFAGDGQILVHNVYECPTCGYIASWLSHFKRHMRTHLRGKPFICPICDNGFTRSDDLGKHIKFVHLKGRPVAECPLCDKIVSSAGYLKEHIERKHRNKCLLCGRIFMFKKELLAHTEATHTATPVLKDIDLSEELPSPPVPTPATPSDKISDASVSILTPSHSDSPSVFDISTVKFIDDYVTKPWMTWP